MKINNHKSLVFVMMIIGLLTAGCQFGDLAGSGNSVGEVWLDEGKIEGPTVTLNTAKGNFIFAVEIADNSAERTKGLMYRESMKDNHGMLFVFENEEQLSFWMKNTLISLDMIFFDSNYKVVYVQKVAEPCKVEPCAVFSSVKPAKYVLEVKAGTSDRLEIKTGDSIQVKI